VKTGNVFTKIVVMLSTIALLAMALTLFPILNNGLEAASNMSVAVETLITLPQGKITVQKDTEGLIRFIGENIQTLGETGEPSMAYQGITLLLPPAANLSTVKATIVDPQWTEMDGKWDIPPIPPIATWDGGKQIIIWPEEKNIVDGKNVGVYTTNAIYPAEPIGRIDTIVVRELKLAQIYYATYRYNPLQGMLYQLTDGTLKVTYEKDITKDAGGQLDLIGIEAVQQEAINFDEAITEYGDYAPNSPGCYVIITTSAIQSSSTEFADFVASKESRGFVVHVITEGTWGGGTGDTAAENIRSWLQSNYLGMNIEYVLLIGNPDPSSGDVPMKMLWPRNNAGSWPEAPSDFYYAELTSNWDADSDGKYGEYDDDFSNNPPRGAEVKVGRIPYYGTINDLDHILSKITTFENAQTGDISWRQNVLLPMEPSDGSTPGYHLGEEIKDSVVNPEGWGYHRVYEEGYGLTPPPETTPCSVSGVTNAWNGDQFGGIFWWTHGSETSAADIMDLSHAATLDDSYPGFTFQCSCFNGHPETTNNLGYSLLENGCVATISATRVSWYYIGQTSFAGTPSNSGLTYEYSKRLITDEMDSGSALNDIRLDITPSSSAMWMNYLVFNLYGCPAVGLYTSRNSGVVYHDHQVNDSSGNSNGQADSGESISLNITLENLESSEATNVSAVLSSSDPYVSIIDDWQFWGAITANSTSIQLDAFALDIADNIPDQRAVSFLISATGNGTVSPPWNSSFGITVNAPKLTVASMTIDDSSGNGNGVLDPGETVDILVNTSNAGHLDAEATTANLSCASSYITVNTPSHDFGTLSCGESDTAVFNITVNSSTPIGTLISINYTVVSSNYYAEMNSTKSVGCSYQQVGYGTTPVDYPFYTYWMDSRTQSILLADEIQFGGPIRKIKLYCTQRPGQNLEHFFIRMQHTTMDSFPSDSFVNGGWTYVLNATDVDVSTWNVPGWVEFQLTSPFAYDGVNNLLIDYCINNSFYTYSGLCYSTEADDRSLTVYADDPFSDLLNSAYGTQQNWFNNVILTGCFIPTLIAPQDGSLAEPGEVLFKWNAELAAANYTIQIDTADTFDSPELIEQILGETQFATILSDSGIYYWHVCAIDGYGHPTAYSDTWTLTIAAPVIQITDNSSWDEDPAITQTDEGTVWVVWESDRSWNNRLWYKTSPDLGYNWSSESPIDTGYPYNYNPDITQTSDGRLWLVWYDHRSGNADLWYMTSPDYGASWSPAVQLTTDSNSDYNPSIAQSDDGTIWVAWYSYRSGNADIWYKTSSDGGANWSAGTQLTTDTGSDYNPSITQDNYDGKVWIAWQSYRSGGDGIWVTNSIDGGATWVPEYPADIDGHWGYDPEIASTDDGVLWLVWYDYSSGNRDIWYETSVDGGVSGSLPIQFTRFMGRDDFPAAAGLFGGELALVWRSDRASNYDIWYGVIGRFEDTNPPPNLNWAENDPQWPEADQVVTIRADVDDESGINYVQLVWWQDGIPQPNITMYDDGLHDDYGYDDGVYGTQIGPFPFAGTVVEYKIQITDIGGNTIVAPQYPFSFEVQAPFVKTADILLVADNPGYGDWYIHYYTDALENAGYAYNLWEIDRRGSISSEILNQYLDGIVIWSTPEWGWISLSEHMNALSFYLDSGGKLFISGQNIGSDIGWSWLYTDYLHAQYIQNDIGLYGLFGVPDDPISDGLYENIYDGYGADNQYAPDEIDPIPPAEPIFIYDPASTLDAGLRFQMDEAARMAHYNTSYARELANTSNTNTLLPDEIEIETSGNISSGTGGLRVDTGTYRVVYLAFGFEAINTAGDRAMLMDRVLRWLSGTGQAEISVSPLSQIAGQGRSFEIDVIINPVVDIAGAQFDLNFDASLITINSVTEGNLLNQGGCSTYFSNGTIDNIAGTVIGVAGVITTPGCTVSNVGTFATLNCTSQMISGTSTLNLSEVIVGDIKGDPVTVTVYNGSVRITPRWDVNCDGKVNVLDMILVGQHWGQAGPPCWIPEDVNCDGIINVLDMILIGQHWGEQV